MTKDELNSQELAELLAIDTTDSTLLERTQIAKQYLDNFSAQAKIEELERVKTAAAVTVSENALLQHVEYRLQELVKKEKE